MKPIAEAGTRSAGNSKPEAFLPWQDWPLITAAGFALIWIFHRASVQSITLDEATTYHYWVAPASPEHWTPHSNNHVLNSALMRLFIGLFGLGHVTVRAPALLGGVIYIVAVYLLSRLLAAGGLFRFSLFLCLVYNPFIMDYLVAARGYGLALGFLTLAIYLLARILVQDSDHPERDTLRHAAAISACVSLAISANFSFAYACGFLLLVTAFLAWIRMRPGLSPSLHVAAACLLPAVTILTALVGSTLIRFPRDQLFWGSDSLLTSWRDIHRACFDEVNPLLVNPLLAGFFELFKNNVFTALAAVAIACAISAIIAPRDVRDPRARSRCVFGGALAVVLAATILAHWFQFKLLKIPLPFERTSLFVVPLATAMAGAILSFTPSHRFARAVRAAGLAILFVTGIYFVGELRDSYFREWRIGADVRSAFPVVVDLCRRTGTCEVASDLNLTGSFNFYRELHRVTDVEKFANFDTMPAGKDIYVVLESRTPRFDRQGLVAVWRGSVSDLVVLVRSGRGGSGPCRPPSDSRAGW